MVGLDAWELEHLLHRLAAANTIGGISARRDRRRHRSHAQASSSVQDRHSVGAPLTLSSSLSGLPLFPLLGAGSLLSPVIISAGPGLCALHEQDIYAWLCAADGNGAVHDGGHVQSRLSGGAGASSSRGDGTANGISEAAALHPSSWPPASQRNLMPQVVPPSCQHVKSGYPTTCHCRCSVAPVTLSLKFPIAKRAEAGAVQGAQPSGLMGSASVIANARGDLSRLNDRRNT